MELSKQVEQNILDSVAEATKGTLVGYDSPFTKLVQEVVNEREEKIKKIVGDSFDTVIKNQSFKKQIKIEFEHKVAKLLVAKLEGSVEKAVNALRQDETLRAKMILAVENIVKENYKGE